ncbi:hypothetical protein [Chitinophaga sp.]|uniref:HNH endonuclease n=1 Tax=Chitinophaga sp. TaxID=1869181 RepID=UPI0031E41C4A
MIFSAKSQPPPPSLATEKKKASGSYRCDDVLDTIKKDFYNKCYICEQSEPITINIEHFVPHRGNHDLKFEWANLYYACGHCNNTKLARPMFDDILDVTNANHEADKKVRYHINPYPKENAEFQPMENTEIVNNTVVLLDAVYNGTTTLKTIEAANLRSLLLKEIRLFQGLLFDYYDETYTAEEKESIKNKIIRHLRPASNFTAFKRWVIRDNENIRADFDDYCK